MPVVNVEAPVIKQEVLPAEVKVDLKNPINVEIPELKQPEIYINAQDYTKLLTSLKESVDKLVSIMDSRPKEWEVIRDNRGFIQKVKGHEA